MTMVADYRGKSGRARVPTRTTPSAAQVEAAEDAKRAAQRYLDVISENETLRAEEDHWRNRAIACEDEVHRLKARERELQATIDHKVEQHAAEREQTRQAIAVLRASYTHAANVLLDGFAMLNGLDGQVKAKISLQAVEQAIAQVRDAATEGANEGEQQTQEAVRA